MNASEKVNFVSNWIKDYANNINKIAVRRVENRILASLSSITKGLF